MNQVNKYENEEKLQNIAEVTTLNNLKLQVFIKIKHDIVLPWEGQIQNYFNIGFLVETWTRPQVLPNICQKGKETLGVTLLKINNYEFKNNNDHSKWGVSANKHISCYGDLNRTESQKKRAGMVLCFENTSIASQIHDYIQEHTNCSLGFLS